MDCRKELKKKLSESYDRMMKLWMASTPAQLVAAAEEIAAARFIRDSLTDAITEGDAEFLLGYGDPFQTMADQWRKDHGVQALSNELVPCIRELSEVYQTDEAQKITVRELLTRYPSASFNMMTPGGYIFLTPEQAGALLAEESVSGNPGCSGHDMEITAGELLPQKIQSMNLEKGVWRLLCDYPEMEQGMEENAPGLEVSMC